MGGWCCANCGGRIFVGSNGDLGLKLVCLYCQAELGVSSLAPREADWADARDWEDDGGGQAALGYDRQVGLAEEMREHLVPHSLSEGMPWA
jgi:hypothetical protein